MPYTTTGKNNMITALGVTHAAAFQGDPSAGGTELDRKAITLAAASGGSRNQTGTVVFDILAGETVNHIAYFDASSGGNLLMWDPVTAEVFGANGTYTLTASVHDLNA